MEDKLKELEIEMIALSHVLDCRLSEFKMLIAYFPVESRSDHQQKLINQTTCNINSCLDDITDVNDWYQSISYGNRLMSNDSVVNL